MTTPDDDPVRSFAPEDPAPASGHYLYDPDLARAVRVALATSRPLLLRGAPGCGKTTLAADVARRLGRVCFQQVVTSRTEARDLEWHFDAIRRLSDAQINTEDTRAAVADAARYVEPQVLWWGFNPESARKRGGAAGGTEAVPPGGGGKQEDDDRAAVVLIDEIDKAEPELANDLLEPFDRGSFTVAETGFRVERVRDVFLVVTTNEARDLPGAFLRRCVVYELERPKADRLKAIAQSHHAGRIAAATALAAEQGAPPPVDLDEIAKVLDRLAELARKAGLREPGTAEFLDAVAACARLAPRGDDWNAVMRLALWKHPRRRLSELEEAAAR